MKSGQSILLVLTTIFYFLVSPQLSSAVEPLAEKGTPDQDSIYSTIDGSPPIEIFKKASSPDAVLLQKDMGVFKAGTVLVYFVDFAHWKKNTPHSETLAVASSIDDGTTWSAPQQVTLAPNRWLGRATDASVLQRPDGSLWMYFMSPGTAPGQVRIQQAMSHDGITFDVREQSVLITTENPEVIETASGFIMFVADYRNEQSKIFLSTDGLNWNAAGKTVPGAGVGTILVNGKINYYFNGRGGILQRTYPDTGTEVLAVPFPGMIGEPVPVVTPQGKTLILFKRRAEDSFNKS